MAATLLLKGVAFPLNSDPLQRIRRSISSPLPRIMIVARAPPRARNKSNETVGSVPRTLESQESVDAPNEVTKLFSSTGTLNMAPASLKNWNLTDRHLFMLSAIACAMGGAVIALFVAAIPTLLAFKRAAESLEKLLEVTREELPGTMAAVRLSGMEISDLTMELSELGQEISSGVKSSARAVRAAQDGLRRVSNIASTVFLQEPRAAPAESTNLTVTPTARGLHERLMQVRLIFHSVATLKYLTGCIGNLWIMRKSQSPRSTTTNYTSNIQHARNTF